MITDTRLARRINHPLRKLGNKDTGFQTYTTLKIEPATGRPKFLKAVKHIKVHNPPNFQARPFGLQGKSGR